VRPLDDFLPTFEFSERHALAIEAEPARIDRALREVSISEIPVARALFLLRGLGRAARDTREPFLGLALLGGVLLDDSAAEGVVIGLTGQFWRLRGGRDLGRPRTATEFLAYDRPDVCKAVIDFRIAALAPRRCGVITETRVHVADAAARRAFRRYWRVVRPFSGLTRTLFLRAVRRRAENYARPM
jgi:hypothetical protein